MERIAVIGAGNIGEALISGLVASGVDPAAITATNRSQERSAKLAERYGVRTTADNREAVRDADVALLCVKPGQVLDVIADVGEELINSGSSTVLVSLAAGITLAAMDGAVSAAGTPIVRVMPNTPMVVGKGVLAVACGRFVDGNQRSDVVKLLSVVGQVVEVSESQMDAVTAISDRKSRATNSAVRTYRIISPVLLLILRVLSHGRNIYFYFADASARTSSDTAST